MRNFLIAMVGTVLLFTVAVPQVSARTWYRADSHNFVIYSDGSQSQLQDYAVELEKFDALLRLIWRRPQLENPNRLTIYLVPRQQDVARLNGSENVAGFYHPSLEGSFAVSNREITQDKTDLSGKRVLFHEYAHHFMFANFSIPAPAWFMEGFAEFVSTAEFLKNGDWYFGKPAFHRASEIEYYPRIAVRELLSKRQSEIDNARRGAYYGWAWALTHLLYMERQGRGAEVNNYISLLNRGVDTLTAATQAFGDLDALDRDLRDYVKGSMSFSKSTRPLSYIDEVAITSLSDEDSRVVELTMKRLSSETREEALTGLRDLTSQGAQTAEAWYQLARAEFDAGGRSDEAGEADYSRSDEALDRALSIKSNHVRANILKARIKMIRLENSDGTTSKDWDALREQIIQANNADPDDPVPLYYFATSMPANGPEGADVTAALAAVFERVPEASETRIAYAFNLANNKRYGESIQLLTVLANDPHGGESGRKMIAQIEAMRDDRPYVETPDLKLPIGDDAGEN